MTRSLRTRSVLPRRLRRRLPARVRQNWKLLTTCTAFLAALTLVLGTERIRPYVISGGTAGGDVVTMDLAGAVDLFDAGRPHEISLTFRDTDYERMLDTYWKEGEKEYVEADLTVDGTTIPSVGLRLKGNSTLGQLSWKGETRPFGGRGEDGRGPRPGGGFPAGPPAGGPPQGAGFPDGGLPDGAAPGAQQPGAGEQTGGGRQAGGGQFPGGGQNPGGMTRAVLRAEEPETLPWLISFDEFVEGRRYQGHREVAVRVGGMGGGSTVLNEALSLSLLDATGEPAQRYAYSSFTVNGRPTAARLLVEHPDEHFADQMDGNGVLYKSLASGSFTDQGDDPTEYADDFKQITMKGSQDLQPVINLIRWVNSASDEEFDAHLADRVDVASFARYVALQNLLLNFDDMAGPGKNYYLWYDLGTKKFSVISWDHNLTFSGNAGQGPHDSGGFGMGRGLPGAAGANGAVPGQAAPGGTGQQPGQRTGQQAAAPPGQPAGPGARGADNEGGGPRGGMTTGHKLKERFLASDAFKTTYEDVYRELYQQVFGSGKAAESLTAISTVLKKVEGADAAAVDSDVVQLRTLIGQRTESLGKHEVIARS
ncbi:CotH kinase family protein [Micromonospora sp. HUAS LYJ1]|uniref:CotH kinase family protein n=1 Tax=Micromonospora sp. HUAS LYJ1 TaxID=3061626 RepID=UPI0026735883|nr:CotH kinase family protein [Micromonospora sp. HUAS LYJ1]WKU08351.1 CotH kinase family protein [Micromonospora sp. HUAS LYJ1]